MLKLFFSYLLFLSFVIGCFCYVYADSPPLPTNQYLMVDQHGNIRPEGYAAGLTEIAQAEAAAVAAQSAAQAVAESTKAASNVVNDIVQVLTGSVGFGYVTGYTVGIGGVVEVSTNATAQIVYCQFGQGGTTNIGGIAQTGHYIWHAYSEQMNTVPAIKYKTTLEDDEDWEFAEYQSTAEYSNQTVNGTLYETVYRSTVYLPSTLDSSFFLAFCEIYGGGSGGGMFQIENGFSIGGKTGFSGTVFNEGLWWTYKCGALMSVTNEVSQ